MNSETLQNEMEQVVAYLGQLKDLWDQEIGIPLPSHIRFENPNGGMRPVGLSEEVVNQVSWQQTEKLLDALHLTEKNAYPIEAKYVGPILDTVRKQAEFMDKVERMRQAQRSYFSNRRGSQQAKLLERSKMLEGEVDQVINDYRNPKLL